MVQEIMYKNTHDEQQVKAFMDVLKAAYERGTTDSTLTTQEFVEEIKTKLMSIYA